MLMVRSEMVKESMFYKLKMKQRNGRNGVQDIGFDPVKVTKKCVFGKCRVCFLSYGVDIYGVGCFWPDGAVLKLYPPLLSCQQINNFLWITQLLKPGKGGFSGIPARLKSLKIFLKWDFMGENGKNINKMEIFGFFSVILERPIKA